MRTPAQEELWDIISRYMLDQYQSGKFCPVSADYIIYSVRQEGLDLDITQEDIVKCATAHNIISTRVVEGYFGMPDYIINGTWEDYLKYNADYESRFAIYCYNENGSLTAAALQKHAELLEAMKEVEKAVSTDAPLSASLFLQVLNRVNYLFEKSEKNRLATSLARLLQALHRDNISVAEIEELTAGYDSLIQMLNPFL